MLSPIKWTYPLTPGADDWPSFVGTNLGRFIGLFADGGALAGDAPTDHSSVPPYVLLYVPMLGPGAAIYSAC